jgi:glycolate oxidase FAD binding subunit
MTCAFTLTCEALVRQELPASARNRRGVDSSDSFEHLAAIAGEANISQSGIETPSWWPVALASVVAPGTVAEVAEIVRWAEAHGTAVLPSGSGSHLQTGYPPAGTKPCIGVRSARLNRIIDYQPDDLTVTCEPGVTLTDLQNILAERRQCLALDAPLPDRSTLGGIVSTNSTGFWRAAYGAPRDQLIGLRAVTAGGVEIKGGGRVVKNVAGYDICKLFTGAWGTAGFLTELTFRVRPIPEVERVAAWEVPTVEAGCEIGLSLYHARLALAYVAATNEMPGRPLLIVGTHGSRSRVDWQVDSCADIIEKTGLPARGRDLTLDEIAALRDVQARLQSPLAARITCLPAETPSLAGVVERIPAASVTAQVSVGTISSGLPQVDFDRIATIQAAIPKGANLRWQSLETSDSRREQIAIWGERREDFQLQRALKQAVDPSGTFSPGRFYGRL